MFAKNEKKVEENEYEVEEKLPFWWKKPSKNRAIINNK